MNRYTSVVAKNKQKVKLRVGDLVRVITGKDKCDLAKIAKQGANKNGDPSQGQGRVLKLDALNRKVLVEGLNIVKKAKKPRTREETGEIIETEAFMDISNVMFMCSHCNQSTRIGYNGVGKEKKRICRKCTKVIDRGN